MSHTKFITYALITTLLAGCTEPDGSPGRGIEHGGALSKTDVGVAAGVIGGGVIGSTIGSGAGAVAATIAGGLIGGAIGDSIGSSLDNADRARHDRISQRAMETGNNESWNNPDNGNHGSVHPHHRFTNSDGQSCREYTQVIYINGEKHTGHGTACREADGSWKIVE